MRYVTRAAKPAYIETPLWGDDKPLEPALIVDGPKEIDTGLVDGSGCSIYRVQEPIGFGRDDER